MNIWDRISPSSTDETGNVELPGDLKVNNHVHTPWSFSSFDTIDKLIEQAGEEKVSVLGINDFNTIAGYDEFAEKCISGRIFPLFNIEMIGLDRSGQEKGLTEHDPGNPGRTYISGKGLARPSKMSEASKKELDRIRTLSNRHVELMTEKVNKLLAGLPGSPVVDFDLLRREYTSGMVRERHLAAMIRILLTDTYPINDDLDNAYMSLLGEGYGNTAVGDYASIENLIRSKLLKAGGRAFVEEDPGIFISPEAIRDIILDAGGIPTYPFLADYNNGEYTDFEADRTGAASSLIEKGFFSVEFIPHRNEYGRFKEYANFLYDHGFIVSFGTEHNAPGSSPLEVFGGGGAKLEPELMKMNIEASAIIAAHQYLTYRDGEGYLTSAGKPKIEEKADYIQLGNRLISSVVRNE